MAQHNELGKKGEQLAIDFLLKNTIIKSLEKNYRYLKAEVDIIAQKADNVLAAVEVKDKEHLLILEIHKIL